LKSKENLLLKFACIYLISLLLFISGCALGVRNEAEQVSKTKVIAILANQDVADLSADDIVIIMKSAGFSDDEILDLGTDLRNALSSSGLAQIQSGKSVEAIFAVKQNYLHISSQRKGSFIFDIKTHQIR
jgi:hypothetical protein